ncbi:MAG: hypothetical protein ABL957_04960 [Parvularculaceae bacterium]
MNLTTSHGRAFRAAALIGACLLLTVTNALGRTVFPVYGTDKDPRHQDECPGDSYLMGVKGNVGAWLDNISVVCGTFEPDGSTAYSSEFPPRGGGGGGFKSTACAPGEVVTVADFFRTEDYNILGVQLLCKKPQSPDFGAVPRLMGNGDYSGNPPRSMCPSGEYAKGLVIGAKNYVTGLSLVCDCAPGLAWRERYQDDKVCVPPTERFRQADGTCRSGYVWIGVGPQPNQCVTPAERTAASAAAAPKKSADVFSEDAKDFHGTWTTVSRGVTYEVVLRVSGTRVSGVYTSPGRPGGTITGAAKNYAGMVKLDYVWNSDAGGGSEGNWKVTTDGRLLGGFTVREPGKTKPVYYRWEGSRITRDAGEAAALAAADRNPAGKSAEQCAAARQRNEARCLQMPLNYRPVCTAETAGIFAACQGLAAQAAAGGGKQARQARVILPVEVYDAAGGAGAKIGDLAAGIIVRIVSGPSDDWFEVAGDAVPNKHGFVYNGESYRSLKEE